MKIHSAEDFQDFIGADGSAVVHFSAVWSGGSRELRPKLEILADKYLDVRFAEVDFDELEAVAQEQGVEAIPAVCSYHKGRRIQHLVGVKPADLDTRLSFTSP